MGCEDTELSVWLTDDPTIQDLHREYFGIDEPTNVISFAQREGEYNEVEPEMLGDVVISVETATRDALEAGSNPEDEVAYLLIHGVLHLLGYDHEGQREADGPEMYAKEREISNLIGI